DKIVEKHRDLSNKLMSPDDMNSQTLQKLSKELASLSAVVDLAGKYKTLKMAQYDLTSMLSDPGCEAELKDMAEEELAQNKKSLEKMIHEIKIALLPKDRDDDRGAILEV